MPQLNPSPWFTVMIITWVTMMFLLMKLTNTQTYSKPTQEDKPPHHRAIWPW